MEPADERRLMGGGVLSSLDVEAVPVVYANPGLRVVGIMGKTGDLEGQGKKSEKIQDFS